jgi:hypothetical protein
MDLLVRRFCGEDGNQSPIEVRVAIIGNVDRYEIIGNVDGNVASVLHANRL